MPRRNSVVIRGLRRRHRLSRQADARVGRPCSVPASARGLGGKGSELAVAAAALAPDRAFITRLGADAFGDMALATEEEAGVTLLVTRDPAGYTGRRYIFLEQASGGNNAIIIAPGWRWRGAVGRRRSTPMPARSRGRVFLTQLEQPLEAAARGLERAAAAG